MAPDFTLRSSSGSDVTLSSFQGVKNVLLAFFPLAFTGTCTLELGAFNQDLSQFEDADTVVLPISVDSTATLKEFQAREHMTFDLLSDFKREVSRAYGVLNEDAFHSRRAYFVIDRGGVVRWAHVETEKGVKRENRELLDQLHALSH